MRGGLLAPMWAPDSADATGIRLKQSREMTTIFLYYFLIKIGFFYSLVRAQVTYDLIKDHYLFLGVLYTAAVAFLSLAFLVSWQGQDFPQRRWNFA